MGCIVREKVKGSGEWWLFIAHHGRRTSKRIGDKRAALTAKREVEIALARGDLRLDQRPEVPTFAEVAERWLAQYPMMRGVRPSTSEAAESVVRLHLVAAFGGLRVNEIPRRRVRDFLVSKVQPGGSVRWTDKPLSHGAMKNLRKTLRLIFDAAVFDGHITENPAAGRGVMPRQQSAEDNVDPFSADDLQRILIAGEQSDPEMRLMIELWARSGMRAGEIAGLQERDVDYKAGTVTVERTWSRSRLGPTKTGRTRTASILHPICETTDAWKPGATPESRAILTRLRSRKVQGIPTAFIFGDGRRPLHPAVVNKRWRRILRTAGVRYREPEQLRHTFASAMLSRGAPLTYVQAQGGWKSATVLLTYYSRWLPSADLHPAAPSLHPAPVQIEQKPTGTETYAATRTSFLNS